ncbi:hypothetical protein [Arthrobacter castelli]|uniref:hypothetical protein n=1 Tax=Arthrobacter castelli TaxID=271431 RepID=UPI00041DCE43|nr:hypothetical protein [Arthrobacter castelli]
MRAPDTFRTSQAFWRAITDQAKAVAKDGGRPVNEVLRRFIHERFLLRVFSGESRWVLKGGNAVLARVADARTTLDVDLLGNSKIWTVPSKTWSLPRSRRWATTFASNRHEAPTAARARINRESTAGVLCSIHTAA